MRRAADAAIIQLFVGCGFAEMKVKGLDLSLEDGFADDVLGGNKLQLTLLSF